MGRQRREHKHCTVDQHVAERMRAVRNRLGLSLTQVGRMIGVSGQQVHKYEKGINSISAGALYAISQELEIPISYFFEEMKENGMFQQFICDNNMINVIDIRDPKYIEALRHLTRVLAGR
jgi:transcriptional regulator with XRE-family HTH domain